MPTKHIVFEADQGFISNAPTPPPQTYQQMMYEQRLRMGYRLLKDLPPPNENPKQALHFLAVESALVPAVGLADDHHNSNNCVHDFHRVPDMAAYICDHLLNSTAQHSFRLLLQGDKTASLHIHHSCTIILRPVVEALKVSIYLFTSKTSPFLYESDGSRGAIGIFLRASSIEQVAQFVPLVMARHTPKEEQQPASKVVRGNEEAPSPAAQYHAVKKKEAPRVRQVFDEVGPEQLLGALHGACARHIWNRAHVLLHDIETRQDFRGTTKTQLLTTKRQWLYSSLMKPTRLPDFIMPNACQQVMDNCGVEGFLRKDFLRLWEQHKTLFRLPTHDEGAVVVISAIMDTGGGDELVAPTVEESTIDLTPFDVWRSIFTREFEASWQNCHASVLLEVQRGHTGPAGDGNVGQTGSTNNTEQGGARQVGVQRGGESAGDSEAGDVDRMEAGDDNGSTEGKATITTTLSTILRPDLVEHMARVIDLLEAAQWNLTDTFDELSILCLESLLIAVQGILQTSPKAPSFDIRELLPPGFVFRDKEVNPIVSVAPLDERLWSMLGNSYQGDQTIADDAKGLFGQSFIAYLYARFIGPNQPRLATQKDSSHPLWDRIVAHIRQHRGQPTTRKIWTSQGDVDAQYALPHPVQPGLSQTCNTYCRDLAQDINNIWTRDTFNKLLNYTIRTVLRLNLAPNKEQQSRNIQQKKDQPKSVATSAIGASNTTNTIGPTIKDLSFKTKKLMTQLDRLLFKDNTLTTHFRIDSVTAQLTRLHQFMVSPSLSSASTTSTASTTSATPRTPTAVAADAPSDAGHQSEFVSIAGLLLPKASADMVAQDAGYYDYDGDDDEDYGGNEDDYQTESQVETHEGNNADQTLPNDSTDQEKEPNASRMTALQTVTRNLLLSSRIERQNVDVNWVRRSSFSKNDFTTKECEVVAKTVRILRSYIPSQGPQGQEHPGRHNPLLLAPFCIIANTLLRAAGYSKFTRRLSPIPSVADLHALTLSSTGLFEVLCGYQDGRFKVCGPDGPITDFQQVTKSVANRDAMFASFFDMNTIKNLCASHGVVFAQRVTYVDRLTVRILGDKIQPPLHNAVRSALDSKRKSHAKTGGAKWSSESRLVRDLGFDAAEEAKVVTEELRLTESDLRTINKDITRTTKSICNVKKAVDVSGRVDISNVAGSSGSDEMNDTDVDMEVEEDQRCLLKELRGTLSELQLKRIPLAEAVRQLKSTRYYWQKCSKSIPGTGPNIPAEVPPPSLPTWDAHTEDYPQSTELDGLIATLDDLHKMVASGSDYGLSTMCVTVALLLSQVDEMIARYPSRRPPTNISMEQGHSPDNAESPSGVLSREEQVPQLLLPRPHAITANSIQHLSGSLTYQNLRLKLLRSSANANAQYAISALSNDSLHRLTHPEDIERSQAFRRSQRVALRAFENSRTLVHARRTNRLQKDRTIKTLLARERDYIKRHAWSVPSSVVSTYDGWCTNHHRHHIPKNSSGPFGYEGLDCPLVRPNVLPLMCIGDAGMGIGSRLKGHYKAAGHYLRREHRRYCSILWTPEFRTSKLCSLCFEPVHLVRARRQIGDDWKTVRVNGATVCSNPDCIGHKFGYTIRGRDTQAAANICLVGMSISRSGAVLQPFARFSRPAKVDRALKENQHQ